MGKAVFAKAQESSWQLGGEVKEPVTTSVTKTDFRGTQNSSRTCKIPPKPSVLAEVLVGPLLQSHHSYETESMTFRAEHSVLARDYTKVQPSSNRAKAGGTQLQLSDGSAKEECSSFKSTSQTIFKTPRLGSKPPTRLPKSNFDRAPPRDPPGKVFNIITGKLDRNFSRAYSRHKT
mmetsp:Transcript_6641/g.12264  ORF Transcript_6641/g.12264 Transcript_6641/m.12264 type:complete len:176 (+) Transcript_6641:41-568(+)